MLQPPTPSLGAEILFAQPRKTRQARRDAMRKAAAAPAARARFDIPPLAKLLLACAAVIALFAWIRLSAPQPWSYDEYYHLGLSREMRSDVRIESFRWTPFSILYDEFVDGAPLFHLLLLPIAGLPLETAGFLAVLLGQVFVVGAFAASLWMLRVPRPWWFVLALPALGSLFLYRLEMCRPQIWLVGFAVLTLALLVSRRWKALLVASALFGLAHTGGWIAIAFAGLWVALGLVTREGTGTGEARFPWQSLAATVGGWLAGQLVHPEVPANFRLFVISNFVIPFQATGAGDEALKSQLGTEIARPALTVLLHQWPAFIPAAIVVLSLLFQPRLRTRGLLTTGIVALAFLLAGSLFALRFFELGAPLCLFALALVLRERREKGLRPMVPEWGRMLAGTGIALGALWSVNVVRSLGFGLASPPRAMAEWLGENGRPGERVFTAQWADSAPLLYHAPQLQSLVALDPTVFHAKDPALFETYVRIVQGRHWAPVRAIREQFGARWVTVWKVPAYQTLAFQLFNTPGSHLIYQDDHYQVYDLGGT
jgi:hypothetical protein